jgi:hypothetical protein
MTAVMSAIFADDSRSASTRSVVCATVCTADCAICVACVVLREICAIEPVSSSPAAVMASTLAETSVAEFAIVAACSSVARAPATSVSPAMPISVVAIDSSSTAGPVGWSRVVRAPTARSRRAARDGVVSSVVGCTRVRRSPAARPRVIVSTCPTARPSRRPDR